jgi:hypothetical protein
MVASASPIDVLRGGLQPRIIDKVTVGGSAGAIEKQDLKYLCARAKAKIKLSKSSYACKSGFLDYQAD